VKSQQSIAWDWKKQRKRERQGNRKRKGRYKNVLKLETIKIKI
jgi:hypothetical protein